MSEAAPLVESGAQARGGEQRGGPARCRGVRTGRCGDQTMAEAANQDAISMLEADHRRVEELFGKFEQAGGEDAKERIALQICTELKVHTVLEEEIFYPALRGKLEDEMVDEAY